MRFRRSSGVLLHPTSLPGPYGIGDLGTEARHFVDFLAAAGQSIWQVLPLGPTGFGDSPYQLLSVFAGNPLLLSLDLFRAAGWLADADIRNPPQFSRDAVDFGHVIHWKNERLRLAASNFRTSACPGELARFKAFRETHHAWLDDYALFSALKDAHGSENAWNRWEPEVAARETRALASWIPRLEREMETRKFLQWQFFEQWAALRQYAGGRGIRMMGDLSLYVAHDSADVWTRPEDFQLDAAYNPTAVSGVPPDYFSATGQLWGHPIYRWDRFARNRFQWWVNRVRAALLQVDLLRLDHFRGLEAYWEVPAGSSTAINGRWVKGPGSALLEALEQSLGPLPLVAENLGHITPDVEALRARFSLPGTAVLQFAFGDDPQAAEFLPHNYPRNRVAYTGTHDNDTSIGWWNHGSRGDSTRTSEEIHSERVKAKRYLATDGTEINWVMIRALLSSVADLVIFPLQDILGLGSEARMNIPSQPGGNWRWRYRADMLTPELTTRLRDLTSLYEREV